MKILFTSSFYPPYHIGGDAVHVKYLAEALAKMGHEVHILHSMDAYDFKNLPKKSPEKSHKNITIHALNSPLGRLEPILNYCFGTQKYTMEYFTRLVEKEKFDVVHHHNISLLGYNILRKLGPYRNLYTAHDYWLICHKYDYIKGKKQCSQKNCLSCCLNNRKMYQLFRNTRDFNDCVGDIDRIIAPSRFMANSLKEEFQNVEVINNFIPDSKNPAVKIGDYFIFAGVVTENKGIFRLIDVFSGIDKRLIIVGTGDAEARAKALIAAKDINNIEMVGWKNHEELFKLIASAQALIIPSIWPENNPLIGLESLSLGTPVIGSTWGGIPEIVEKVDKQLVFRDLSHLVKIIHSFDRKNYPPAGIKKLYQQHFSQEIFFKKYFNLIKTAKNEIK